MCGYYIWVPLGWNFFCPKSTYIRVFTVQKDRVVVITIFIPLTHKWSELIWLNSFIRHNPHERLYKSKCVGTTYGCPYAENFFCLKSTYIRVFTVQKERVVVITIFIPLTYKCSEPIWHHSLLEEHSCLKLFISNKHFVSNFTEIFKISFEISI